MNPPIYVPITLSFLRIGHSLLPISSSVTFTLSLYVFSRFLLVLSLYLPSSPLPYFFLCHWQLAFYILRLFLSFSLCIFWNTISLSGFTLDRPTRNFVCYLIKVFVWKQKLYSCCCCWCCSAQWRWCWWLWCCLCHHFYNPPLPP